MSYVEATFPTNIKPDLKSLGGRYHSIVTGRDPDGVTHVVIIKAKTGNRPYPCCTVKDHPGESCDAYNNKLELTDPHHLILWIQGQTTETLCNP